MTGRTSTVHKPSNNKVFGFLLVILFIIPWAHGGEVVWQYLFFSSCIFTLTSIYFINNLNINFINLNSVKIPLTLLGVWLLFQLMQAVPLPSVFTDTLQKSIGITQWRKISIAPNLTFIELIKHTSYITIFILSLTLLTTKKRILTLTKTLFCSSAIIALYSLVNHYTKGAFDLINSIPPWTISWEEATHGTFSYQNHYASFLTLTIPLGFGLIYQKTIKSKKTGIKEKSLDTLINFITSSSGFYLFSCIIMLVALFKTASRGGITIFVISIAITFIFLLSMLKVSIKKKIVKLFTMLGISFVIILLIATTGTLDNLAERLNKQGFDPNGRDLMHNTALAIIKQRPLVGTGAGTYPALQHKYKDPGLGNTSMSKRAHNDYLELLSNQGLIGFTLLGVAIILLYIRVLNGLRQSKRVRKDGFYGIKVAALCSITAILLHSLADFNFHLPANTLYFFMIVAISIASQKRELIKN